MILVFCFHIWSSFGSILSKSSQASFFMNSSIVIRNLWVTCPLVCGSAVRFNIFQQSFLALFLQIQFREKVLWTAITLFIFLVCCQVSRD